MMKIILGIILAMMLFACADDGDPTETVTEFLEKRVAGDANALGQLACADWEGEAPLQAESFASLDAAFTDLTCENDGESGDYTLVRCQGEIEITYTGEQRQQAIEIVYQTIQEDGEWRVCGEAN